jgi:dihydroorotate dehydrogenase
MGLYTHVARPLLFTLSAEAAHSLTIAGLRPGLALKPSRRIARAILAARDPRLSLELWGLSFHGPIGLAAGLDKNGVAIDAFAALGFSHVEIGTVTALPQPGNDRPRLFRLVSDRAVINRMGFNNHGQPAAWQRLQACMHVRGVVGANVGANKDSPDRIADYAAGVRSMSAVARYITVNISSPNTPGLRGLQDEGALDDLLAAVAEGRTDKPIFLKVAPDLNAGDPERIVKAAIDHKVDALIVGNTTVSRPPLKSQYANEQGGLSGEPLKALALDALRKFRAASGGKIPLIGVGGISNADDAWERIRAGASLIQLYTAMIYEGPGIARRIARGLAERLKREGMTSISDAVG